MTKEEYLQMVELKWPELAQLKAIGDFYAYEKRFAEIWLELDRSVLESSMGDLPADRRKKREYKPDLDGLK